MIYVFIDESGDTGEIHVPGASQDFVMAGCFCYLDHVDIFSGQIKEIIEKTKKKELKYSKMNKSEIDFMTKFIETRNINHISVYTEKTPFYYGDKLLSNCFTELLDRIPINQSGVEKIKIFIDGKENAKLRKIYEPIMRKRFPRSTLKFANSLKTPLIQIADFCAGYRRKIKK
jgi:hypothetical protein